MGGRGEAQANKSGMATPPVIKTKKFTRMKPMALGKVIQDDVPVEVVPGLFIGSVHCAFNDESLLDAGITHVVNLAGIASTFPSLFVYLNVALRDKYVWFHLID